MAIIITEQSTTIKVVNDVETGTAASVVSVDGGDVVTTSSDITTTTTGDNNKTSGNTRKVRIVVTLVAVVAVVVALGIVGYQRSVSDDDTGGKYYNMPARISDILNDSSSNDEVDPSTSSYVPSSASLRVP